MYGKHHYQTLPAGDLLTQGYVPDLLRSDVHVSTVMVRAVCVHSAQIYVIKYIARLNNFTVVTRLEV